MRTKKLYGNSSARKLENSYLWNINMNNTPISCLLLHTPGDSKDISALIWDWLETVLFKLPAYVWNIDVYMFNCDVVNLKKIIDIIYIYSNF